MKHPSNSRIPWLDLSLCQYKTQRPKRAHLLTEHAVLLSHSACRCLLEAQRLHVIRFLGGGGCCCRSGSRNKRRCCCRPGSRHLGTCHCRSASRRHKRRCCCSGSRHLGACRCRSASRHMCRCRSGSRHSAACHCHHANAGCCRRSSWAALVHCGRGARCCPARKHRSYCRFDSVGQRQAAVLPRPVVAAPSCLVGAVVFPLVECGRPGVAGLYSCTVVQAKQGMWGRQPRPAASCSFCVVRCCLLELLRM